ncbi:MAG: putative lipid II flippase FtsW [Candidatus Magnetoovum sp. WYHC-5]|nr:putative lipid II flippase FtsW [Candidatus Magnetoovum sp. WYHC-5]
MNINRQTYLRITDTGAFDKFMFFTTLVLVLIGVFMVYSSSSVVAPNSDGEIKVLNDLRYLKKHLFSVCLGYFLLVVFYKLRIEILKKRAIIILLMAFALLGTVFLPGIGLTVNGARRWVRLLFFTFQPSEFMKVAMVIFLSWYLSREKYKSNFISFIIPILIMGTIQGVLLLQPDFGSALSIGLLTFSLLFISGVKMKYLLSTSVVLLPAVVKLLMEPYRLKRILSFLDPWADEKQGGFQLIQSFIALGNGGLYGVGIGKSTQKLFFLPESKTDFIFSIVGEEMGFIGTMLIIMLFLMFFAKGIQISRRINDDFLHYLSTGLLLMIVYQAVINMGVVSGLLPTKGLPLPFISYGGTSMIVNLSVVGLLLNIAKGEEIGPEVAINRNYVKKLNKRTGRVIYYDRKV